MVDNRGVTPVSAFNFKSGDISGTAAKTSEEKMGQGGEYFAQEMQEEFEQEKVIYADRSAQLRASLDSLAMVNAGSMIFMKKNKEKIEEEKRKSKKDKDKKEENEEEIFNN